MIIARMTAFVLFFMSLCLSVYGQNVFPECRFHFGTDWEKARGNSALMGQVDYLTGPWIGTSETFNIGEYYELCRDNNKVPVNHTYIIAFAARRDRGLQDCNVDQNNNLCKGGAKYIRENRTKILNIYGNFARGVNNIMGSRPSVWLMEADFTQYTLDTQDGGGLSYQEAGQLMKDMISTIKTNCPSAYFSIDISPWRDNNMAEELVRGTGNGSVLFYSYLWWKQQRGYGVYKRFLVAKSSHVGMDIQGFRQTCLCRCRLRGRRSRNWS